MYKRKTTDEWCIFQNYGYGDGYEKVDSFSTYREAKEMAREYRLSSHGAPTYIKKCRVKNTLNNNYKF